MDGLLVVTALSAPAALLALWLVAERDAQASRGWFATTTVAGTWLSVVVALSVATFAAVFPPTSITLVGDPALGLSLRVDALSATILGMVSLLAVVIVRFARTYLEGNPRRDLFLGRLCAAIATVQLLVLAGGLTLFLVAWIGTSLALRRLLLFYPERRRARISARKELVVARLGELALIAGSAVLVTTFGTADLAGLFAAAEAGPDGAGLELATALLAVAALLKAAQFPTHGWLVEIMETPTPVSALLHAGILNAGPFLILRFAPLMDFGTTAAILLVAVGGFTALFASTVLLTQPAVKIALGYSSAAHMGFSLLMCGLGVYAAAALHLVAHSFYKAHAFLSSGSALSELAARRRSVISRRGSRRRMLGSLLLASVVYLAIAAALGLTPAKSPGLLAVGAVFVLGLTHLLATVLDSDAGRQALVRTIAIAAAIATTFFLLEEGARRLLVGALPQATPPSTAVLWLACGVLLAFAAAVLAQIGLLRASPSFRRRAQIHLRNGLYTNALFDRLVGAHRR